MSLSSLVRFPSLLLSLTLTLLTFHSEIVWAGIGFQPVSPDELSMKNEPLAPGAPAVILFREVDRDDNGRTSHEDSYYRVKILTEEGRKYADIEIPFVKQNENVVGVHARTIRPDGSIVNFEGKAFDKTVVKGKGIKYLAKTFTLPDVQVGSIIEYFYTDDLAEDWIFDSHWILSDELFIKKAHFTLKPYSSYYSTYRLRWNWQGLPPGSTPAEGPDHIVRMDAANIPAFQHEDFMPPDNELKSRVDFIYEDQTTDTQPDKFWKHVGKKWNDSLESFVGKRKAMEQAVSEIVSPGDAQDVKLRKIYARVQQLRNTSFEVEKTEQEEKRAKEKPAANVEEVWKRGFGSGVELTWLFLGLARAAGFEAYGCWVSDRRHYFFTPNSMQPQKLNANVVLVKMNGKDLYFDPGAAFTPFGVLTWSETGTAGLRLDRDGGTWIQTTLPQSSESQIQRSAKLKLSGETGDLEGKLTITYSGLEASGCRLEQRHADQVERKKFLEDLAQSEIPAAAQLDLTNQPDWKNPDVPLVAEFNIKIPGWASSAGRRVMLPVGIFALQEKQVFDHASRVHPIYFEYPFEKLDDVSIELPAGWHVSSVPKPRVQDGHVIVYEVKAEDNQGVLHLKRKLSVDILLMEQKYYTALRNFFQIVRSGDEEQIVLQPGAATASN